MPSSLLRREPFRLFFPAGLLFGITGVLGWPLYFADWISTYPAVPHARLMIEGLMAAFIFGFLGTAGPKLTESGPFSLGEIGALLGLQSAACALHLTNVHAWGDAVFAVALLGFLGALARRFLARADLPPPQFVLVALGLLCGLFGSALLAATEFVGGWPRLARFGGALLGQGFVLLPALGAGAFLLRKFLGLEPDGDEPLQRLPSPEWRRLAWRCAFVGGVVIGTYALEALSWPRLAGGTRAVALVIYLAYATPFFARRATAFGQSLRVGLASAVVAAAWLALAPFRPISGLHVLFLGGFSVLVFTVGMRVILGHGGEAGRLSGRQAFLGGLVGFLVFILLTRIGADFSQTRAEHLILAAVLWILAAGLWAVRVLPAIVRTDDA